MTEKANYPLASAFITDLMESYGRFVGHQTQFLLEHRADTFWPEAERVLGISQKIRGSGMDAFIEYTLGYLKEQVAYMSTGNYAYSDFCEARANVYDSEEVMLGYYLEGLMLSVAFWPIHLDMHAYFKKKFLPLVSSHSCGTDIGFGHGLYLLDVLEHDLSVSINAFDISPHSSQFTEHVLSVSGIDKDRYDLHFGDISVGISCDDHSMEWAVFSEVLEHIPDPGFALHELKRLLKPNAPLFLTTVVQSNAMDHLYEFKSVGEILNLIKDMGFELVDYQSFKVTDYAPDSSDPTIDVACICKSL